MYSVPLKSQRPVLVMIQEAMYSIYRVKLKPVRCNFPTATNWLHLNVSVSGVNTFRGKSQYVEGILYLWVIIFVAPVTWKDVAATQATRGC